MYYIIVTDLAQLKFNYSYPRLVSAYTNKLVDDCGNVCSVKEAFLKVFKEISFTNFVKYVLHDLQTNCR